MTASGKMYLKAIYYLSGGGAVRPADIADGLGVSGPSVSNALMRLANEGLLEHESYGDVSLTPAGRRAAQALVAADERLRGMGSLCAL
jgi:DtxR family Mn-dependent transcriptional regulator